MTLLNILRSEPDKEEQTLIEIASNGLKSKEVRLFEGNVDYDELIDLIFEYDKVFSW